jgi:hypothetical protein
VTSIEVRKIRRLELLLVMVKFCMYCPPLHMSTKYGFHSAALTRALPSRIAILLSAAASFVATTVSGV